MGAISTFSMPWLGNSFDFATAVLSYSVILLDIDSAILLSLAGTNPVTFGSTSLDSCFKTCVRSSPILGASVLLVTTVVMISDCSCDPVKSSCVGGMAEAEVEEVCMDPSTTSSGL